MAAGFTIMDLIKKNASEEAEPSANFETKNISIHKMYRNSMNFYGVRYVEELAEEIKNFGLKQNLEVIYDPCELGEYRIIAGERRWEALKYLVSKGFKQFEFATSKVADCKNVSEEQVEIIVANSYRDKSPAELLEEEQRLKESLERIKAEGGTIKGYDLKSGRLRDIIASMLNTSPTKIGQIESINNNLIPEFKEQLSQKQITFSAAYELSGMKPEKQREVLDIGELSHREVKAIKANEKIEEDSQIEGQMVITPDGKCIEDSKRQQESSVSESDTESEEYEEPEEYEYEESEKAAGVIPRVATSQSVTDAYSAEQTRIDRETKKRLQDRSDEEKMNHLPSEEEQKVREIPLPATQYDDIKLNVQTFLLIKNERYKVGELLDLIEYKDGSPSGRVINADIIYMVEEYTGLQEGYCILGINVTGLDL